MLLISVFDDYTCKVPVGSKTLQLSLWDTAGLSLLIYPLLHSISVFFLFSLTGQQDFDEIRPMPYTGTDVFLLCFSVDNRNSFRNIKAKWKPELKQHQPKVPILLVGTKCDLREDKNCDCIPLSECQKLAEQIGAYKYDEVSAMKNYGVRQAFEDAIRECITEKKSGCTIV